MKSIAIEPVDSRSALSEFIKLPAKLYAKEPHYTAPLNMERRKLLDPRKAPFFEHGRAQYWIARSDHQAVGRISAQIDEAQPPGTFNDAGLFGCLDAIDDVDVVRALIEAAQSWLVEQGRGRALGPCTLSMNGEPGLLVEGQAEPALILVPWHPPYLAGHLEACGYTKCQDLHYWRADPTANFEAGQRLYRHASENWGHVSLRQLDMKNLDSEIEVLRIVYNDAWKDNWGFIPLMPEDLHSLKADLKPFLRSEFGLVAEIEGRPVGVALALPNLFEITGDLGASPSLIGWAKLGYRTLFHRFRSGRVILFGVVSEFRPSLASIFIAAAMIEKMMTEVLLMKDRGGNWIEGGWVLEDNKALRGILRQFGFERSRTLRLYDKALNT